MSTTSDSTDEKPMNNCHTCEQIKNISHHQNSSNYSSDCEADLTSSCSVDESFGGKEADEHHHHHHLDSFRLNFDESKLGSKASSRSRATVQANNNKTFSSEKIREIERKNALLVDRILYHDRRPNQYKSTDVASFRKATSSEINRRRHQEKISRENQILLKKIQSVKPAVRYA